MDTTSTGSPSGTGSPSSGVAGAGGVGTARSAGADAVRDDAPRGARPGAGAAAGGRTATEDARAPLGAAGARSDSPRVSRSTAPSAGASSGPAGVPGTPGTGTGAPATGARGRLVAYARLAKFEFVLDYYLSMVVLWTALAGSVRFAPDTLTTLLLFLLGEVGVISAVMALDDVNGIRDGSDRANYLGTGGTPLRPLERKPLLTGALTVNQATRFGYLSLLWGAVFWTAAALAAPERPLWALVVTGLVLFAGFQYSWGLKLSYRGLGEVLIMGCPLVIVVAPYGFVTGHLPATVLVQAVLFGLWQILVSCYSNTKDISGDAAVGRSTVAVHASARGNLLFIGALSAADLLLTVGASAVGWAPWWFFAALLPEMALRLRQFTSFSRNGDALLARRRGVVAFRTGVAGIVLANLIHFAS
ncbi:UbiA family prenyltransferase [Streptomyces niveus]|uniref:UbiA family prenyltransferase n=1 Tax=Streptomyces niveus TaxID=193462 RepID=UPI0034296469|nr:UbiA family prenyltransferase [Streptomyces niveus]